MSANDGTPGRRAHARRLAPAVVTSPVAALPQHRTYPSHAPPQTLHQGPISQGLPVGGMTNAHAGIGQQFPAQIPVPGHGVDVLSGPMPTHFHTVPVADYLEHFQVDGDSVSQEGILGAGVNDFELPNGRCVVEDYHLVGDGQGPLGTCVDHPRLASCWYPLLDEYLLMIKQPSQ